MEHVQAPGDIDQYIPEWVSPVLWIAVLIAAVWFALTLFVYMRRRASNLTSAHNAGVHKDASPDFLKVDHKAREAQIKRGENFEKELTEREKEEAKAAHAHDKQTKQVSMLQRIASVATVLFSVFSLVSTLLGVVTTVDRMNQQISKSDVLLQTMTKYPIPFAVCIFVIGYHLVTFFTKQKWADKPDAPKPQ